MIQRKKEAGRSRTSYTDENCVIVEGLMREHQRAKVHEILEVTGITKRTIHENILDLNMHTVSACWVLKKLNKEHKSKRMVALLENLCHYEDKRESFVESILMGNKTWVHEFTPERKINSMSWKHPNSPITKPSAKKNYHVLGL
jgi:hypothetical protein